MLYFSFNTHCSFYHILTVDWPNDWLTDWLTGWLTNDRQGDRRMHWLTDWLTDGRTDGQTDGSGNGRRTEELIGWRTSGRTDLTVVLTKCQKNGRRPATERLMGRLCHNYFHVLLLLFYRPSSYSSQGKAVRLWLIHTRNNDKGILRYLSNIYNLGFLNLILGGTM